MLADAAVSAQAREGVVFFYQRIDPRVDAAKFEGARLVVTSEQDDEAEAIETIHAAGAKAYRYVNMYWYPADRTYQGIDIGSHIGWAFCRSGATPLVGRTVDGVRWYYLDANERRARQALVGHLRGLAELGYDGVFFDRGAASLRPPRGWTAWRRSECTQDPVMAGRPRFADVFADVVKTAKARLGFDVLLNFGPPFARPRFRPDPDDRDCRRADWARCRTVDDLWRSVDGVVDETLVRARGRAAFELEYAHGRAAERDARRRGRIAVVREIKLREANRRVAYYLWSRTRLFRLLVFVNTGDDGCPTVSAGEDCFRYGTYPELTRIRLGRPLTRRPQAVRCSQRSTFACLWLRRYSGGMTVVNPTASDRRLRRFRTGLRGCRAIENVYRSGPAGPALLRGGCTRRVSVRVPAQSGRVLVYHADAPSRTG